MVEVYFSTTIRSSPLHVSGELIKLDWPSKTILKKRSLPHTASPMIQTHVAILAVVGVFTYYTIKLSLPRTIP